MDEQKTPAGCQLFNQPIAHTLEGPRLKVVEELGADDQVKLAGGYLATHVRLHDLGSREVRTALLRPGDRPGRDVDRYDLSIECGKRRGVSLCLALRPDQGQLVQPVQAAKLVLRSVARRARLLEQETGALEKQLSRLVANAAPRTVSLFGVSTHNGGQLLVSAGENIERLHSEAAFAHLCGASPIPASSGRTVRHRLNPGGDRQANRALHMVAVSRLRYCERTRAYAERRSAEGLSKREVIRCLKRYIARELYHTLRADLAALTDTSPASSHEQPQPRSDRQHTQTQAPSSTASNATIIAGS